MASAIVPAMLHSLILSTSPRAPQRLSDAPSLPITTLSVHTQVEGEAVRRFDRAHAAAVTGVAHHPTQPCMVTAGADGLVRVWQ